MQKQRSTSLKLATNEISISDNLVHCQSMASSTSLKRSRKSQYPSKSMKFSSPSSLINHLTSQRNANVESSLSDDESKHSTDENESEMSRNFNKNIQKRPRLSHDKRLEANARERERVHNLTAAFESLRRVIPMYGDQTKLSRLSILRIACSYVLVLGALNEIDFSEGRNAYTFNESFQMLSSTILNELKRKKTVQSHRRDFQ